MCEYIVGINNNQPVYADGLPPAEPFVLPAETVYQPVDCESGRTDSYIEQAIANIALVGGRLAGQYGSELLDRVV